jgi:DNA-binding transcriptional MerR regulator
VLREERTYTMEEIERETGLDRRTIAYYVQEGLLPRVGRRGPRTRYPQQFLDRLRFIQKVRGLQDQGQLGNYTLEDIREIFETVPEHLIADIVSGKEPLAVAPYGRTLRGEPDALGSPRERIERLRRLSERQRSAAGETAPEVESRARPARTPERLVLNAPEAEEVLPQSLRRADTRFDLPASSGPAPEAKAPEPPEAAAGDDDALFFDLDSVRSELRLRRVADEADDAAPARPFVVQAPLPEPPHPLVRLLSRLDRAAGRSSNGAIAETWTRAEVTPDIVLTVRGLEQDSAQLVERIARLLRAMLEGGGQR